MYYEKLLRFKVIYVLTLLIYFYCIWGGNIFHIYTVIFCVAIWCSLQNLYNSNYVHRTQTVSPYQQHIVAVFCVIVCVLRKCNFLYSISNFCNIFTLREENRRKLGKYLVHFGKYLVQYLVHLY